jgi:hypothetical protein
MVMTCRRLGGEVMDQFITLVLHQAGIAPTADRQDETKVVKVEERGLIITSYR